MNYTTIHGDVYERHLVKRTLPMSCAWCGTFKNKLYHYYNVRDSRRPDIRYNQPFCNKNCFEFYYY